MGKQYDHEERNFLRLIKVNGDDDETFGNWEDVDFMDLKLGDVFKFYEPNGDIFMNDEGKSIFKVTEAPYYIKDIEEFTLKADSIR